MLEKEIVALLASAKVKAEEGQLEKPPQPEFGDVSFPCFPLAKVYKKSPMQIADELAKKIRLPKGSVVQKVESRGGYVNFFFDYTKFSKIVLGDLEKKVNIGKKEKVMVEYSSPNPVHPMHVGSSRNTFLGDSLSNILDFAGYDTIRANYINNVGLQVAKMVLAYKIWANGRVPEGKPDAWLWQFYVRFHEEAARDPSLDEKAQGMLKEYESGSNKNLAKLWDTVVGWCVSGFEDTYRRVGVKFDVYFYEDKFRKPGKKIVEETLSRNISRKTDDGAVFADLESNGLPGTIIQRSNGTGLYITSDLGLTVHKFDKYKIKRAIWVAGAPQELHFQQVFKILELLGYKFWKDCKHFSYELVQLAEGKMSSREGRAVMMDEVLDKLTNLAHAEVDKRNPEMPEREKREIAVQIGTGALKYAIVRIEPQNQITFDWEQMLSLEGNTGPYLQYAHTRCLGILKRAKKFQKVLSYTEMNDQERALVRKLSEFKQTVEHSSREMRPHLICNYGYDLATAFNSFYQHSPVLNQKDKRQTAFRLNLVKSTKETLEKVFQMVGMEAPDKM